MHAGAGIYIFSRMSVMSILSFVDQRVDRCNNNICSRFGSAPLIVGVSIVCGDLSSQGSQFIAKANKSLKIARDEFKEVNRILGI